MLVSFAVENYACFRDRQELNLEAVGQTPDLFALDSGVARAPRLNRVSAIYGPNGSGKSYLVEAMDRAAWFVTRSVSRAEGLLPFAPFRFDPASQARPTTFEFRFIQDGVLYRYEFAVHEARVMSEALFCWFPGGRKRRLLTRSFDPASGEDRFRFGRTVPGPKRMWQGCARPDSLLFTVAATLDSEVLAAPFRWFERHLVFAARLNPYGARREVMAGGERKQRILEFLQACDLPVVDIEATEDTGPAFGHLPRCGESIEYVDIDQESAGAGAVFRLAPSWLEARSNGLTLVVDDLDSSQHPLLLRWLVHYINRPAGPSESEGAQLVATLHDATLLDADCLHRGQVWFTEKDRATEAAALTPLSDFRRHRREALTEDYLLGRFGAVPIVQ